MSLSKPRRQRNRHPRPALIVSPPAPIAIIRASVSHDPANTILLELSGNVIGINGPAGGIFDFDQGDEIYGVLWADFDPNFLNCGWPDEHDRIGHRIGWIAVPPWLGSPQLQLLPNTSVICVQDVD